MFDTTTALVRVSPLILSTTLLTNRIAQYFALSTFLPPYTPRHKQHEAALVFQTWVRNVVSRIWSGVIILVLLLRLTLALNVFFRVDDFDGSHARAWYIVGLVLSFAHLAVAKPMLLYESEMKDEKTRPLKSIEMLRKWLSVNNVRVLVIDVPMVLVTVMAATEAMAVWMGGDARVV